MQNAILAAARSWRLKTRVAALVWHHPYGDENDLSSWYARRLAAADRVNHGGAGIRTRGLSL